MKKEGKRKNREDGWRNGRIGPKKRSRDGGKVEVCCPRWQSGGLVPLRLTMKNHGSRGFSWWFLARLDYFKPIYGALFIT
jgi:hypothetical protein